MNAQRIGITVFGAIGLGSALAATLLFRSHFVFFSRAVETTARVTWVEHRVDQNREPYEFTHFEWRDADAGVHTSSATSTFSGETFTLWYDPDEPSDARHQRMPWLAMFFTVFAAVFGGIALQQLLKSARPSSR